MKAKKKKAQDPSRIVDAMTRKIYRALLSEYDLVDKPLIGDISNYSGSVSRRGTIRIHTGGDDTFVNVTRRKS